MRRLAALTLTLASLVGTGCLRDDRALRERGGGIGGTAPTVRAPPRDRCVAHGASAVRSSCDEARFLAAGFVRRLAPGDDVCIEGGFGEAPGGACQARARVVDVGDDMVLLELREAQPDSRWFKSIMDQVWYEEGALVDLYLSERGY